EQEELLRGRYYVFNVKVDPTNSRLFAILFSRDIPGRSGRHVQLVTMKLDGSDDSLAMPDRLWRKGGHHPNWMPDGRNILMNLKLDGRNMSFVQFDYRGENISVVAPGHKGSGHPSLH